ncbi:protease complex subunit PrcB family protein [Candidatus Pacearchaeota archaeon]|nr:protease complex subunit PrcB family protein [Candidatus Pacearchaeota archaeon]
MKGQKELKEKKNKKKKSNKLKIIFTVVAIIIVLAAISYIVYLKQEIKVPFEVISFGQYSGITTGEARIIQYDFEFQKTWDDIFSVVTPAPIIPTINFKNITAMAFFLGQRKGTGWKIAIVDIIERGNKIYVYIRQIPPVEQVNQDRITSPYILISFKKTNKDIVIRQLIS